MGLGEYNRKRNFGITSEPSGDAPAVPRADGALGFVIQKHAATRLHYDFRLELDGVLLSWSVPKGPSLDPKVKRLAMHVEDHPLAYADFEGIIPKGQYGGGTVLLWDQGTWQPLGAGNPKAAYHAGNLKFYLKGKKLHGGFALVKIRSRGPRRGDDERSWLLVKERDADAVDDAPDITEERPESVTTGRTLEEIAADRTRVWHSKPARLAATEAIPGARAAALPAKVRPPQPAPRKAPPDGDDWLHEPAIDGERLVAVRAAGGEVRLFAGDGTPLKAAAARARQAITDAVRMLPSDTLIVDGIAAPLTEDGSRPGYFLNDLPYLDGQDLARTPLARRKALLEELCRRIPEPGAIRYLDHIAGGGAAFHREACRLGIPAMLSRRADSGYDAKAGWVRVRCPTVSARPKKKTTT
jgi:bifunctional non-homologous end joining protein LigD